MQKNENASMSKRLNKSLRNSLHSTQSISGRASILTYANKQYPSATDALHAYITDFDNKQSSSPYRRTVEDLLSPKSVLLQTVERSLATGVRDTHAETKRHYIKQLIDESYNEILRADLEHEASQQLIESSKQLFQVPSDLSSLTPDKTFQPQLSQTSLSTDTLLTKASHSSDNHRLGFTSDLQASLKLSQTSKHLSPLQESYRANALQLKSLHNIAPAGRNLGILKKHPERKSIYREVSFTRSTESKVDDYSKGVEHKNDSIKQSTHAGLTSTAYKTREFSIPNLENFSRNESLLSGGRLAPSWIDEVDKSELSTSRPLIEKPTKSIENSSKEARHNGFNSSLVSGYKAVPSWIQDISLSDIQNTGEIQSNIGRAPPSWIENLDNSEASSFVPTAKHLSFNDADSISKSRNKEADIHSSRSYTLSNPSLTYHDLRSPSPEKENKPSTNINTRTRLKSSAEIYRLVRNSMAEQKVRKFPSSPPLTKRRISSDMMSMTTDDLILAPSTDRGLPVSRSMEDLRMTVKGMDRIPYPVRNTQKNQKTFLPNKSAETENQKLWQRDLSNKPTAMKENIDRSRLNMSDFYSSPRRFAFNRYREDRKHEPLNSSPKVYTKSDNDVLSSTKRSQLSKRSKHQTGKFTGAKGTGSSEIYEQRVIDRAEKILGSPLTHPLRSLKMQSPNTEEVLDGDRSWEKAVPPYTPLRPVYGSDGQHSTLIIDRFLDDCLNSNDTSLRLTTGHQPGTVEALKNMLFTIQSVAVENDLTDETEIRSHENNQNIKISSNAVLLGTSESEKGAESSSCETEDASKSLKRAMEHLSRLKYLVHTDSENALEH